MSIVSIKEGFNNDNLLFNPLDIEFKRLKNDVGVENNNKTKQ